MDRRPNRRRHYTNDSEAIRDLIRREQERTFEIESIRLALIEGEHSGEPERFGFAARSCHRR